MKSNDDNDKKSAEELAHELEGFAEPGSPIFLLKQAQMTARCSTEIVESIEALRQTIDKHEQTATHLSRVLNRLTRWVIVATFVGGIAAASGVIVSIFF